MYSFGDSSDFPLRRNILETIREVVRSSAELFRCELAVDAGSERCHEVEARCAREEVRLQSLQDDLVDLLSQVQGGSVGRAASNLQAQTLRILQLGRQELGAELTRSQGAYAPQDLAGRVRRALASFWLRDELPGTQWSYRWRAGKRVERSRVDSETSLASAEVSAHAGDFALYFGAKLDGVGIWQEAFALRSLAADMTLEVPMWPAKKRNKKPTRVVELNDYEVAEVDASSTRQRLLLRAIKHSKKSTPMLEITLADASNRTPQVRLIEEDRETLGASRDLSVTDLEELTKLWHLVQEHQDELLAARSELKNGTLANRNFDAIEHPGRIAEAMIAIMAPLVREIRLRSRVPDELILKRDIDASHREEHFLKRSELQELYSDLPDSQRRFFDAMGVGGESTQEFIHMAFGKNPKPRPRSDRVINTLSQVAAPPTEVTSDGESQSVVIDLESRVLDASEAA